MLAGVEDGTTFLYQPIVTDYPHYYSKCVVANVLKIPNPYTPRWPRRRTRGRERSEYVSGSDRSLEVNLPATISQIGRTSGNRHDHHDHSEAAN